MTTVLNARTEQVPVDKIEPHPQNPRRGDIDSIVESITHNGWYGVVIVQKSTSRILAGNHRWQAAKRLGMKKVPVTWVDVDDDAALRILLADNRTNDLAAYDDDTLAAILSDLVTSDAGLDGTGYDQDALDEILDSLTGGSGSSDPSSPSEAARSLLDRFLIPPFTVLDARQGYWQDRKGKWIALGLRSELGRDGGSPGAIGTHPDAKAELKASGKASKRDPAKGVLLKADSARDPSFYLKKRAVETKLGHEISTADFLRDHYTPADGDGTGLSHSGTSVFDPVICELAYRWFSPPGGTVLDPFAGGSVRGVVAAALGRSYVGIDLRAEQVEANRAQWNDISPLLRGEATPTIPDQYVPGGADDDITPIEDIGGGIRLKRDDLCTVAGVRGGKVRSCWQLAQGATGLVTAGSRQSPQVNIVAHIAARLGIPCRVHTPEGELSPEVQSAQQQGAEVIQHKAGRNTVIVARAREDAKRLGWTEIPFGMECDTAVSETSRQVVNIPADAKRLVVPVGSGMSLSGILHGLAAIGRDDLPVLGVVVGADPTKRLDKYAPADWRDRVELVRSDLDYHDHAPTTEIGGVKLDPVYEAKTLPYLEPGDVLWIVGIRQTAAPAPMRADAATLPDPVWICGDSATELEPGSNDTPVDFVFSCPPYADLEVYSDDPRDLSTMSYDDFRTVYRDIIHKACQRLRDDRFAAFVVGDVRGKDGAYLNFVSDTIQAFLDAGLKLYNEAILVTPLGSVPVRTGKQFESGRKLGKTHQNVLVFVKGNASAATAAIGPVEVGDVADADNPPTDG